MSQRNASRALLALLLIVPVPSIGPAAALLFLTGPVGQVIFVASKLWVVLFPAFWLLFVEKGRLSWSPPKRGGFVAGAVLGAVAAAAILAVYFAFARGWIDAAAMRARAAEKGLASKALFIPLSLYWVGVNSLVEEYVWRWFVFGQCLAVTDRLRASKWFAVAASALFFTLHHVIAMGALFDWRVTALGCSGVFAGGVVWSWLYVRYRSVWPAYVSHMIVDVPVFLIGWWLIFG